MIVFATVATCVGSRSIAQTPEQQHLWDLQRAQASADEKLKDEQLNRQRETRKADPMGWVRTLNPLTSGGWQFRTVADDGGWAAYSTDHQLKRAGKKVTVWLRQEYAETQVKDDTRVRSVVQNIQYDCAKERQRSLMSIYYSDNNIQGSKQVEEADIKDAPWLAIIPGSHEELNYQWACTEKLKPG